MSLKTENKNMNIKRLSTFCLTLIVWIGNIMASSGSAGNNIKWELDNEGLLTFSGNGKMKDFGNTPYRPQLVKSVVIDNGITSIGKNAFNGCSNLLSVSIPSTVKEIGSNAFSGCKSLVEITIPYGVTTIGDNAFKGCRKLTELDLPGSVKAVGDNAFADCQNLVKIRIPASVGTIGEDAFKGCQYINKINELPEFVTPQVASRYRLNSRLVSDYWEEINKQQNLAVNTPNNGNDSNNGNKPSGKGSTPMLSDVDVSIPHTNLRNDKTFAVIISNENYAKMENVPYAINDGNTFKNYCELTLGIPAKNIIYYPDATSGIMREVFSELKMANRIIGDDMKVVFYYAGHGAPDNSTLDGYLIPVDASRVSESVCLPLSELFEKLGELDLAMTTVFLDACFSGGERNGGTLQAANGERLVKIKQKELEPKGNTIVFSATSGEQTALPYHQKGHGVFTYYLLKKLKDSGGGVSLAELADYISTNVNHTAFDMNRQEQTPTVSTSPSLNLTWKNKRLNN